MASLVAANRVFLRELGRVGAEESGGEAGAPPPELGRDCEAPVAFDRALALAKSPAEVAQIRMPIERLRSVSG